MPAPTVSPLAALLGRPHFMSVVAEWRLHVENGQDPAAFANLFLECMRDPQDHAMRQACAVFAAYMKPRSWAQMRAEISPFVDTETRAAFARRNAGTFYEGFRAMVVEAIREYWEAFLKTKKGSNGLPGPKDWSPRAKECARRRSICGDPLHRRCGRRRAD